MIISQPKDFEEILQSLEGAQNVFVIGCGECATVCETGGEKQVEEMKARLEDAGKTVTGTIVPDVACHVLDLKRLARANKEAVAAADVLLAMSCGAGTQAAQEAIAKFAVPANDTMFHGEVQRYGHFALRCAQCGQCRLAETGGVCAVVRCSKGLTNGPCGGVVDGKCEVDRELDCGWYLVYEQLKEAGRLDLLRKLGQPRDYSKRIATRVLERA